MSNAEVIVATLLEPLAAVEPEQLLASQFRSLVRARNMTPELWDMLLDAYIVKTIGARGRILDASADHTSLRANLSRELMQPVITWKVFLKGIELLGADVATFFFTILTHDNVSAATSSTIRFPK
jgi:hypothetical protein